MRFWCWLLLLLLLLLMYKLLKYLPSHLSIILLIIADISCQLSLRWYGFQSITTMHDFYFVLYLLFAPNDANKIHGAGCWCCAMSIFCFAYTCHVYQSTPKNPKQQAVYHLFPRIKALVLRIYNNRMQPIAAADAETRKRALRSQSVRALYIAAFKCATVDIQWCYAISPNALQINSMTTTTTTMVMGRWWWWCCRFSEEQRLVSTMGCIAELKRRSSSSSREKKRVLETE